jgi:hypothetical protein
MIPTGVYIDNSAGVYSPSDIIECLTDLAEMVGVGTDLLIAETSDYRRYLDAYPDSLELPQIAYETEEALIDRVNDALRDSGLVLAVGTIDPGVYTIEEVA